MYFLYYLKYKSLWLPQVRSGKIKRRKGKEVNGLKPKVGMFLYSESEQCDGFGNREILRF